MFADSHAHLDGEKFDADREDVLRRAAEAGVASILAIGSGTGPGTLDCAIQVARRYPNVYASIGVHPHEAQLVKESDFAELEELARSPEVVAWGEIGLDYHYDHSPREIQKQVFLRQMELARAAKLPIIIHCRASENSDNAWQDVLELIRQHWASSGLGGILHCFTSTLEHAKAALDLGFFLSFAGVVTFPKAHELREVAKAVPAEHLLIETDCPFLAPIPYRGKRNEPAFVVETAKKLAEIREVPLEEIAGITTQNFHTLVSRREKIVP